MADRPKAKISKNRFGDTIFVQDTPGWPASGFERKRTELTLRRVSKHNLDELQISIAIISEFRNRSRTDLGNLTLSLAQIAALVGATIAAAEVA